MSRTRCSVVLSAAVTAAALVTPLVAAPHANPAASAPAATGLTAAQAFDRLKALAGTWEGSVAGEEGRTATIVYRVISGGSVVEETLFPGSDHEMVSIYSVEGNELRMVHYCALGNQPRFRLDRDASTAGSFAFVLDGGSGFDPKVDVHIHGGRITLKGADAMEATWEYYRAGASQGAHAMTLRRVATAGGGVAGR